MRFVTPFVWRKSIENYETYPASFQAWSAWCAKDTEHEWWGRHARVVGVSSRQRVARNEPWAAMQMHWLAMNIVVWVICLLCQGCEWRGTSREQPYGGKVDIAMVLQGSVKEAASARYEREQPVLLFIETCSTAVEQVTGYAGRVCCGCGDGSWARQCTRGLSALSRCTTSQWRRGVIASPWIVLVLMLGGEAVRQWGSDDKQLARTILQIMFSWCPFCWRPFCWCRWRLRRWQSWGKACTKLSNIGIK